MPDLARVMLAMFELARQTGLRREDRQHLQDVTDLAVWTLLEYLRVGDQAQVGDVCYRIERVTWSEVAPNGQERPHPHGAMALLRGEAILGTLRHGLTRRQQADARTATRQIRRFALLPAAERATYDLVPATDEDRMDFAEELPAVLEALGVDVATHAADLRQRAEQLVRVLLGERDKPSDRE
jgi:hypothetical protein